MSFENNFIRYHITRMCSMDNKAKRNVNNGQLVIKTMLLNNMLA